MKNRVLFLTVICFAILLQGCMVFQHSIFSAPRILETDGEVRSNRIQIEKPGLKLSVRTSYRPVIEEIVGPCLWPLCLPPFIHTIRKTGPDDILPYTGIELVFNSKDQGFSFDPRRVVLLAEDGRSIMLRSFTGPGYGKKEGVGSAEGPVALNRTSYFSLFFDRPSYPDMNFTLVINGLEKEGKPVQIPAIHFQKESAWAAISFP